MNENIGERPDEGVVHGRDQVRADPDQAASDRDQEASERDRETSDADQAASDRDQAASDRDQERSDMDQAASDRDQAASDRELGRFRDSDRMRASHAASKLERSRNTEARRMETRFRAGSSLERARNAAKRDEVAALRDMQAEVRDRTAELRDKASDDHERALGRSGGYAARARATAAEDRKQAAEDRERAAEDRERAAEDRKQAAAEVQQAQMDDLTGFYRPRLGLVVLQHEVDRATRSGTQLVLLYFDVDGLKLTNDTLGHDEGDRLLQAVAEAMRTRLRSYDPVVRLGGDEFVAVLPGIDVDQAKRVAGDIQKALREAYEGASMSFGLSMLEPGDTAATMVKRGDDSLRASKAAIRS